MLNGRHLLLAGLCALPLLAACGSTSVGTESGTIQAPTGTTPPPPPVVVTPPPATDPQPGVTGTDDTVVSSVSSSPISVAVGATQTVSVTFTSSDGLPIADFSVAGSLATLPAGWTGPSSLTCASVGPGSGCVLDLTYAPTGADSGTLKLNCVFLDNAGLARTPGACATLSYAATVPNNVVGYVSPSGEIDAMAGSTRQTVQVDFTTDDGNPATAFSVTTNLSALPTGWRSAVTGVNCAIVSTGNGCELQLTFAPGAAAGGTLALNYSYTDGTGAARSGTLNIPYATAAHGTAVATVAPTGEINAVEITGTQSVTVNFTTDDGKAASELTVSGLDALPPGWSSSAKTFACASVSTGNGCELPLSYAPATLTSGALALNYTYVDDSGAFNAGVVTIPYAATTNDTVTATPSPAGQVNAVVGSGSQAVLVTFATDDARAATELQLTSSLTALPAGWTSTLGTLACTTVSDGVACQLPLTFTPTAYGGGTLSLAYSYVNNADIAKTGTLNIPYMATTDDNVVGTPSASSLTVLTGSSTNVTVTFTTDDGNPASVLAISPAVSLPAGWSGAVGGFNCATVSAGTSCALALTYAPTAADTGTLVLPFSYTDDSGTPNKTGTVSISYTATAPPPPPPPVPPGP